jgi:hypothetical protein
MQTFSLKLKHRAWLLLAVVLVLSGCGGGWGGGITTSSSSAQSSSSTSASVVNTPTPPPPSSTASFSLSWTAPTSRADGTPLSLANIDGYRIYYGTTRGNYPNQVNITNGAATGKTVNNLASGKKYYLVMTTYDYAGRESAPSGEVAKTAL